MPDEAAASPYIGDPNSVTTMKVVDALAPAYLALVHEFGAVIVLKSIDEGDNLTPEILRADLETWRQRRQEQWLRTNYVTAKTRRSFNVVALSAHMEQVRKRRALKVASPNKLRRMLEEEAAKYA
jgi:hypothetical protein